MKLAHSRITAQGQVSVPAEVRKHLAVAPGATLEWRVEGGRIIVARESRHSSAAIHQNLFGTDKPAPLNAAAIKSAIRQRMRKKFARD
jgi:AbrB family looped-hinge helix DNA binding protein